jgi:hypothetical protein
MGFNLTPEQEQAARGLGIICWVTFFVFLLLKLTGTVACSWWWVTCPLWALPALGIALIVIGAVLGVIGGILTIIFRGQ